MNKIIATVFLVIIIGMIIYSFTFSNGLERPFMHIYTFGVICLAGLYFIVIGWFKKK